MDKCPVCERPLKECLGHTVGEATKIFVRQREQLTAKVKAQQDLLDALTTPNVSYFDMTPAEEIAQLEARLQEGQSVLKRRCEECDRYRAALEWIAGKENHAAGLEINSRLRAQIALDPNPTR